MRLLRLGKSDDTFRNWSTPAGCFDMMFLFFFSIRCDAVDQKFYSSAKLLIHNKSNGYKFSTDKLCSLSFLFVFISQKEDIRSVADTVPSSPKLTKSSNNQRSHIFQKNHKLKVLNEWCSSGLRECL